MAEKELSCEVCGRNAEELSTVNIAGANMKVCSKCERSKDSKEEADNLLNEVKNAVRNEGSSESKCLQDQLPNYPGDTGSDEDKPRKVKKEVRKKPKKVKKEVRKKTSVSSSSLPDLKDKPTKGTNDVGLEDFIEEARDPYNSPTEDIAVKIDNEFRDPFIIDVISDNLEDYILKCFEDHPYLDFSNGVKDIRLSNKDELKDKVLNIIKGRDTYKIAKKLGYQEFAEEIRGSFSSFRLDETYLSNLDNQVELKSIDLVPYKFSYSPESLFKTDLTLEEFDPNRNLDNSLKVKNLGNLIEGDKREMVESFARSNENMLCNAIGFLYDPVLPSQYINHNIDENTENLNSEAENEIFVFVPWVRLSIGKSFGIKRYEELIQSPVKEGMWFWKNYYADYKVIEFDEDYSIDFLGVPGYTESVISPEFDANVQQTGKVEGKKRFLRKKVKWKPQNFGGAYPFSNLESNIKNREIPRLS